MVAVEARFQWAEIFSFFFTEVCWSQLVLPGKSQLSNFQEFWGQLLNTAII